MGHPPSDDDLPGDEAWREFCGAGKLRRLPPGVRSVLAAAVLVPGLTLTGFILDRHLEIHKAPVMEVFVAPVTTPGERNSLLSKLQASPAVRSAAFVTTYDRQVAVLFSGKPSLLPCYLPGCVPQDAILTSVRVVLRDRHDLAALESYTEGQPGVLAVDPPVS